MSANPQNCFSHLIEAIKRKKSSVETDCSPLARVLTLFDLISLGVGSTLGLGGYVLAGVEAKKHAGPAVVISFAIGAVASLLAGLCYVELAARIPRGGSCYIYAYVALGELVAFIMGWNFIFGCTVSTASMSRALQGYVDNLVDHRIEKFQTEYFTHGIPFLSDYFDFFSFGLILILTVAMTAGVKESIKTINVLTTINLLTISTAVIAGATKINPSLWSIPKSDIPEKFKSIAGEGGFLPFGVQGVIVGAANCFFGFIGFDSVAATSEESKKPKRNIPIAIIFTLLIVFIAYLSTSTVLTMMRPYYEQDEAAPFPSAFDYFKMNEVKWVVTIGTLCALSTSFFTSLFPLPRILYFMTRDGLIFEFLGSVNSRTQTPVIATFFSGLLSGVMVLLFDLSQLISLLSIACFLSFIVVAISVMVLRFREDNTDSPLVTPTSWGLCEVIRLLLNSRGQKRPNRSTNLIAKFLIGLFFIMSMATSYVIVWLGESLYNGSGDAALIVGVMGATLVVILAFLSRQPMSKVNHLSYSLPLGPWIPCMSLFLNAYLMAELGLNTWIKFLVWVGLGIIFYFAYSIRHSVERKRTIDT